MSKKQRESLVSLLRVCTKIAWYAVFTIFGAVLVAILIIAFHNFSESANGRLSFLNGLVKIQSKNLQHFNWKPFAIGALAIFELDLVFFQVVVDRLKRLFDSVGAGKPFDAVNARYVTQIGIVVIAGVLVDAVARLVLGLLAMNSGKIPGVEFGASLGAPLGGVFIGLLIIALGRIFGRGAELQEDHDLTV
jgi:hypothetical protein